MINNFEEIKNCYKNSPISKEFPYNKKNILQPWVISTIEKYPRVVENIIKLWWSLDFYEYIENIWIQEKDKYREWFQFSVLTEISALKDTHDYLYKNK